MKKFTIDQLRADVAHHFPSSKGIVPTKLEDLINFMVAALIGHHEYEFLTVYPFAVVEFIPVDQDTTLTLRLS